MISSNQQQAAIQQRRDNQGGTLQTLTRNQLGHLDDSVQPSHLEDQCEELPFPDGGMEAFWVLGGCFCTSFAGLALLNCPGTLHAWISEHELPNESAARLGWIFGFYVFVAFFVGIQIGPLFDAYGPRGLSLVGTVLILSNYLLLAICRAYWQIFVTLGVTGGVGASVAITCTVSTVQLWFFKYRALATAAAICGSSVGGIVIPLVMEHLFPKIGYAWTLRAVALMNLPFLVAGCVLMRARVPRHSPRSIQWRDLVFDPSLFLKQEIAIITLGTYLLELGLFIVLTYLSSYALKQGMQRTLSFQLLTYLNCGSFVGRLVAGVIGDWAGRFNTQVTALGLCTLSILGIWMAADDKPAVTVVFAAAFGFASGSNLSLTPVCVGELCETGYYARTFTAVYSVTSIGALTGVPLAGEILERTHGHYWSLILFSGLAFACSALCFASVRVLRTGLKLKVRF